MYALQPEKKAGNVDISKRLTNIICGLLLAIAVLVITASSLGILPKSKYQQFLDIEKADGTAPANIVDRSDACFMSQKFVTQNLKAPSTADFPDWTEDNCRVKQAAGTWIVTSFVDAENGFGAMIRTDYVAQMTYNSASDQWTLKNLTMDGN